jgi:hypothetical protein
MPIESTQTLDPAYSVITLLGGKTFVARELGLSPSTITRWCSPHPDGTGGTIPQRYWQRLLVLARQEGANLTIADLSNIK